MDARPPTQPFIALSRDRDIRVIHLLPGRSSDDLACEVQHVSLDANPPYECLSYRWGHEDSGSIKLGENANLALNQNLLDALHFLRQSDTMRVLWADQICINQADDLEKTKQVGLMGEIYQKASRVVAWLGLPNEKTPSTFDFLKSLGRHVVALARNEGVGSPNTARANDELLEAMIKKYPTSLPQWTYVNNFLERDWFSRIWILQEVVLAKSILVQCGNYTLSWATLDLVGSLLVDRPKNDVAPIRDSGESMLQMVHARVTHRYGAIEQKRSFLSLTALLRDIRARKATDPRDKVYGLLGIAFEQSESRVRPDYTKDWPEVFTNITNSLLAHDKNLSILKPDYLYRSAGNTFTVFQSVGDAKLLAVRGLYVGLITSVSEAPGNLKGNVALSARVLDGGEWFQFAQGCAKNGLYPPSGERLIDAFARLRAGDSLGRLESEHTQRPKPGEYPSPGNLSYSATGDGLVRGDSEDIGYLILSNTTRRRLFITDSGYMGLTHRSNQIGDKVYVLLGGDMPFVLRPKNNHFLFRGEAYVHGIMDGEALTNARQNADPGWVPEAGWFEELKGGPMPFATEEVILE